MGICSQRFRDRGKESAHSLQSIGTGISRSHPTRWGGGLKRYARLAGLRIDSLHVHTLRHTASMLRRAAGDDVQEISDFLGHSSLAITQIYLQAVEGPAGTQAGLKLPDLLL